LILLLLQLIYPLQHPPEVTSTFGAYRLSHHHAGLDLGTGGDDTIPVLAAADGEIYRIRRNDRGYGRALYIRHKEGLVTLYAHLSAFNPKLEALIERFEKRTKSFRLNKALKGIPVKQGEALGYVGSSGTDLVHLHFEVREKGLPRNPLTHGLKIPDTKPPIFVQLLASPRRPSAHVRHAQDELMLLFKEGQLAEPLVMGGEVGLAVEVNDFMEGSSRKLRPYLLEFRVDGKLRHRALYETVSYADKGHTELDFNPQLRAEKREVFHKLYREGPRLRVHTKSRSGSLRRLKPGLHRAELLARDAVGNEARAHFQIKIEALNPPCALKQARLPRGKTGVLPAERIWREEMLVLPLPQLCALQKISLLRDGSRSKKGLQLTQLKGVPALAISVDPEEDHSYFELRLKGEEGEVKHLRWESFGVRAGANLKPEPLTLKLGDKVGFFPFPTELSKEANPGGPGLEPLSPLYKLSNGWRPTRGGLTLGLKAKPGIGLERVGLYMKEQQEWWYLGSRRQGRSLQGSTVHLGQFALMRDTQPPEIGQPSLEEHPGGRRLLLPIKDLGSGIREIQLELDGKAVLFEWMRAYDRLVYRPRKIPKEAQRLRCVVEDRSGQRSERVAQIDWKKPSQEP